MGKNSVVTSKDQNITKAHARYLEARFIEIANKIGKAELKNATSQIPQSLPESDRSDMEYFIEQIRLVLPILGYNYFKSTPSKENKQQKLNDEKNEDNDSPIFKIENTRRGLNATEQEIGGEFIVFQGSIISSDWIQSGNHNLGYSKLHNKIIKSVTTPDDEAKETVKFTKDYAFSSPSAASAVVFGRADNGRTSWKVKGSNTTYAEWQEKQIKKITASN